ncbi:hypothetical protein GCM10023107_35550 [Actinoplanes octamycinicus]|nr:hypothetical protein Aoc01nite_28760 [Actinoplanes octamycinicus]
MLVIDYGAALTRAIMIGSDGVLNPLQFDGGWELSSAVHVGAGDLAVGAQAWQRAADDPDGFVLSPLRAGSGQVSAGTVTVETADLAAATLQQVAAEAARVAGEPVTQAHLVVPAGWGPRRRTWLRHAARTAGLQVTRVIDAPVAAACRVAPTTGTEGRVLLIVDVGAGCEVSVLQQNAHGTEVLATLDDPDAGGDRIAALLSTMLTGTTVDDLPEHQRWTTLAMIRTVLPTLIQQPAVTMALPTTGPVVVASVQAAQSAQPVLERVGELAAQAITAADLTLADVHAVYLIGGVAALPGAPELIAAKLGIAPQVPPAPASAAVAGAAETDPGAAAARATNTGEPLRLPPLRRIVLFGIPGLLALLLYAHFLLGSDLYGTAPFGRYRGEIYELIAGWPELTLACVFVQICLLQAAGVFAALLDHNERVPGRTGSSSRISAGIGIAVIAGPAIAYLMVLIANAYFNGYGTAVTDWTTRWAVLPILPIAGCAALIAAIAWRRRTPPADGWDTILSFPIISMITASLGVFSATVPSVMGTPYWLYGWGPAFSYVGGLLLAVGIACALVRHPLIRLFLSLPLAIVLMTLAPTFYGYRALGALYAAAVAAWCIRRLWTLLAGNR